MKVINIIKCKNFHNCNFTSYDEKEINERLNKNKLRCPLCRSQLLKIQNIIGSKYMPHYMGEIDFFLDSDGTVYTCNQSNADLHYKWGYGKHGIGYYLQNKDEVINHE